MELVKIKKIKTPYLIAALVLGIVLMILPGTKTPKTPEKEEKESVLSPIGDEAQRLENIIGGMDGVSDVSVLITYENTGVRNVQSVTEKSISQDEQKKSEQTKTQALIIKEGSSETPFVSEEILPEVRGVIISARGIKNPTLKASITEAVAAVFGVSVHRVRILHKD